MKNVIIAGNLNYGLGTSLFEKFPIAKFCSRTNGDYDFNTRESRNVFGRESLEYDVCILCSYIPNFNQLQLLDNVWERWNKAKHKGQIIVLGSTADASPKRWMYPIEKRALRDYCRVYGKAASGGGPDLYPGNGIRVTYVGPGMLDLPKQRAKNGDKLAMLNIHYLTDVIEWLINQPENVNIYDITMDPVQANVDKE